jgi:hypothetical protein
MTAFSPQLSLLSYISRVTFSAIILCAKIDPSNKYFGQAFTAYNGAILESLSCNGSFVASLRLGTVRIRPNRPNHEEGTCGDQRAIQGSPGWNL